MVISDLNSLEKAHQKKLDPKKLDSRPCVLLENSSEIILFLVHSFWNVPSDLNTAKNYWYFDALIYLILNRNKILLLEESFHIFCVTYKYKICMKCWKIKNLFCILVWGSHSLSKIFPCGTLSQCLGYIVLTIFIFPGWLSTKTRWLLHAFITLLLL
jgi:hypothetical protein